MRVALVGATGAVGSRVLSELLVRGHEVRALVRPPARLAPTPGLLTIETDLDGDTAAAAMAGADAVVSAVKFTQVAADRMIGLVTASKVRRYLVVGGAGSLFARPGVREMDDPRFPEHILPEARAGAAFLDLLRASDLDWTFLSPSRFLEPGSRTGRFRIGKDDLLIDETGRSAISMEDFAVALVDEFESGRHVRERMTVGY